MAPEIKTRDARLPDPGERLRGLVALAHEMGADEVARVAATLTERIADGRFYVACVGQFKRGKSTLINALVGRELLPAGVVPVTSVVTVVRHGARAAARVQIGDAWRDVAIEALAAYVSEADNPGNRKGVAAAEVFVPCPLLEGGMCLVDTPGIGSVFAANSAATRAFVPHVDAALIVLGADPPISGDELALLDELASGVRDLVIVLNKADRLGDAQRAEARRFTAQVVEERLGRPCDEILDVSAAEALGGVRSYAFASLVARLDRLVRESGANLVRTAADRGIAGLAHRLRVEADHELAALTRPLVESAAAIATLTTAIAGATRSLTDLAPLFGAEQDRISRRLDEARDRYLRDAIPGAQAELRAAITGAVLTGSRLRTESIARAQAIAHQWLERWRVTEQPEVEALYRAAAARFVAIANEFLQRLAEPGLAGVELAPDAGLRARSDLYYTEMLVLAGHGPGTALLDRIVPRTRRRAAIARAALTYLATLLETNTSRIVGDLRERVLRSRRRLETELRDALRAAVAAAERARARAVVARVGGDADTTAALARVDRWRATIDALAPQTEGTAS
jgi:hypothetical protein